MLSITSWWICRNLQSTWNALEDWFPSAIHHWSRVTRDVTHGLTPKLSSEKQSFVNCFRSTKITEVNNYVHFGIIFVLAHEVELSINQPWHFRAKKLNHHDSKLLDILVDSHLCLLKKRSSWTILVQPNKTEDIMRRPTKCWSWTWQDLNIHLIGCLWRHSGRCGACVSSSRGHRWGSRKQHQRTQLLDLIFFVFHVFIFAELGLLGGLRWGEYRAI